MKTIVSLTRTITATLVLCLVVAVAAIAQGNLPPTSVFARSYNGWNIVGQQANTYTFNGGVCTYSPYTNGNAPPFFVFSGLQSSTTVYFPVAIVDADPTKSEIVTPTSTVQGSGSCGFAATTANAHVSFVLSSGTAGLQEAIVSQQQSAPTFDVFLDKSWYQSVAGLPGSPSAASIIAAAKGNSNVAIVDTTTTPWTFYSYNGTGYTVAASNQTVPTLALGQGAGGTPTSTSVVGTGTSGLVSLTTGGTAPTTAATIFTLTWPAIASGGFQYAPTCTITSAGTNVAPVGTTTSVAGPPAVATYTSNATTALTNTTAYKFSYSCR